MKRTCPLCRGAKHLLVKDSTGLYPIKKDCYVCRNRGEVMPLKKSAAERLYPGQFEGLERDGYHPTAGIDQPTNLMIVIYNDKDVENG